VRRHQLGGLGHPERAALGGAPLRRRGGGAALG
jgi:hypothetical protein